MAPVTVFSTYGIAIDRTHGMIPTAYIIALIVMLFTSYSYAKMVQVYPTTGSAYTFVQKGINSHLGLQRMGDFIGLSFQSYDQRFTFWDYGECLFPWYSYRCRYHFFYHCCDND